MLAELIKILREARPEDFPVVDIWTPRRYIARRWHEPKFIGLRAVVAYGGYKLHVDLAKGAEPFKARADLLEKQIANAERLAVVPRRPPASTTVRRHTRAEALRVVVRFLTDGEHRNAYEFATLTNVPFVFTRLAGGEPALLVGRWADDGLFVGRFQHPKEGLVWSVDAPECAAGVAGAELPTSERDALAKVADSVQLVGAERFAEIRRSNTVDGIQADLLNQFLETYQ